MKRRNFIRVVGGGAIAVVAAGAGVAAALDADYPAAAVEAWQGPGNEADPRRRALAYAITAPNPHNLQPWLVDLRESDAITLYCDRKRLLHHTDPLGRQILVGHGAFLELLVLALAEQGLHAEVALWPQGEMPAQLSDWDRRPVARLRLAPGGERDPLVAQVLRRRTPKVDFDMAQPVPEPALQGLLASVRARGIRVDGTVDAPRLATLRKLCLESARVELQTPRTVMESIRLTRIGPAQILRHRDGISVNGAMPRIADALGMIDREAPPGEGSPAHEQMHKRFNGHSGSAMGFVWLATAGNSRAQQVDAGRAYVRLQLKATQLGVGMHPMSQALQEFAEMAPHYAQAHALMAQPGETLQMFCRIGYPPGVVAATPRRPLEAFLATT